MRTVHNLLCSKEFNHSIVISFKKCHCEAKILKNCLVTLASSNSIFSNLDFSSTVATGAYSDFESVALMFVLDFIGI